MLSLAARPTTASALVRRVNARAFVHLRPRAFVPPQAPSLAAKRASFGAPRHPAASKPSVAHQHRSFGGGFSGRGSNAFSTPEGVVYGLIAVNGVVYFLWSTAQTPGQRNRMATHFTTSARHLDNGLYHTMITSVFSHADFGHLFANMIGLYFFGREISYLLGPRRFLGLYLASGVVSSWAAVQEQKRSRRMSLNLGASGAVNSITALSILLFPHSTLLIFGIVPIPAWVAGSMFIGRDLYGYLNGTQDGIGHFAHLSGAACGGLYYAYMRRGMRLFR